MSGATALSDSVPAGGRPKREGTIFTTSRGASVPFWPVEGAASNTEFQTSVLSLALVIIPNVLMEVHCYNKEYC